MSSIIIEPESQEDYSLFVNLAKRLNIKFTEQDLTFQKTRAEKESDFFALSGSFDLPETSDELIDLIESSRTSKDIDFTLD